MDNFVWYCIKTQIVVLNGLLQCGLWNSVNILYSSTLKIISWVIWMENIFSLSYVDPSECWPIPLQDTKKKNTFINITADLHES